MKWVEQKSTAGLLFLTSSSNLLVVDISLSLDSQSHMLKEKKQTVGIATGLLHLSSTYSTKTLLDQVKYHSVLYSENLLKSAIFVFHHDDTLPLSLAQRS